MSVDRYSARRFGDRLLLGVVDAAFAESAARAGEDCACRVGCTECCQGPFPITALDTWRLREGFAALQSSDAARAAAVRARAEAARERMREGFPGNPATGALGDDEHAEEAFCERHRKLACPALDPASGACDLYDSRPISCRTYGPPVRFGQQDVRPCRLWFQGASPETVERCRVEPDPEDQERDLLESVNAEGEAGETFVAFALAAG